MLRCQLLILFGSRATQKARSGSDTDIAVLADHALSLEEKSRLAAQLAAKFGFPEDSIDLVDLWNAPPLLQHRVAQEGKLLEGNEFDFIRFKVLAWKRYQDTAKLRRLRSQNLQHYVKRTH